MGRDHRHGRRHSRGRKHGRDIIVPRKAEEEEDCSAGARATVRNVLMGIVSAAAIGPLLCVTIHQVCVSKCLITRRLPKLSRDVDDLILISLFFMYLLLNFVTCCVVWSLACKGAKAIYQNKFCCRSDIISGMGTILVEPRVTRSGRPYGYRNSRYVVSPDTGNRVYTRAASCECRHHSHG